MLPPFALAWSLLTIAALVVDALLLLVVAAAVVDASVGAVPEVAEQRVVPWSTLVP